MRPLLAFVALLCASSCLLAPSASLSPLQGLQSRPSLAFQHQVVLSRSSPRSFSSPIVRQSRLSALEEMSGTHLKLRPRLALDINRRSRAFRLHEGTRDLTAIHQKTPTNKVLGTLHSYVDGMCNAIKAAWTGILRVESQSSKREKEVQEKTAKALQELTLKIEHEIERWVSDISAAEDQRLAEMRTSLDALNDIVNNKIFRSDFVNSTALLLSGKRTVLAEPAAWSELRRTTDERTKVLLMALERTRDEYDRKVYELTDVVKPLSQEEIVRGLGGDRPELMQLRDNINSSVSSFQATVAPLTNDEVNPILSKVSTQIDNRVTEGLHILEEQMRAGVERARFQILQRARNRPVDTCACGLQMRGNALYFTKEDGAEVELLTGMDDSLYVDDTDGKNMFIGVKRKAEKAQHIIRLGGLSAGTGRWLSCARQKLWWMSPDVGSRKDNVPPETQFFLAEAGQGQYVLMLPLVGTFFRTSLWGAGGDGRLDLRIESGDPVVKSALVSTSLYIGVGADPYKLLDRGFAAVADRVGTFKVRQEKPMLSHMDDFGWCTWDAFYSKVDPKGIKMGLEGLIKGGTPARFLILDDGWQSTENDEGFRAHGSDTRQDVSADQLAGGGVIEGDDYAASQLTSIRDLPARLLTWWYTSVVEKSDYDSTPVRVWQWLTHHVIKNDLLKYFAEATDWSKRLTSVLPNGKFEQLGSLVKEIKQNYGLTNTFCWHALTGYWLGVDPQSPGMKRFHPTIQYPCIQPHFDYTPSILAAEPTMAWNPSSFIGMGIIPPSYIRDFFGELHSTLKDAGIDGVKVDAQAAITMLGAGYGGGPQITRAYVHAMEASAKEHLGGNVINCMCHPTENLYSFKDTSVARASDDFYPREPASHTVHINNVVYNSLFLGEIVTPDWDMFQSEHPAAGLHAAARAVGGCAVYTSDRPDVHNFTLLRKLVLPDGSVLRAKLPGRPTRDCLFSNVCTDGRTALKVFNLNDVNGVIGVFNLQGASWDRSIRNFKEPEKPPPMVIGHPRPHDVEGLKSPVGKYAVWSHSIGRLFVIDGDESVSLALKPQDYDVLTVAPCVKLNVQGEDGKDALWAPVGLTGMFNGGGAILSSTVSERAKDLDQIMLGGWVMGAAREQNPNDCLIPLNNETCLFPLDAPSPESSAAKAEDVLVKECLFESAVLRVRGQGKLLCYSTLAPTRLTIREDMGTDTQVQSGAHEWDFEHRAGGELWVTLPPMSGHITQTKAGDSIIEKPGGPHKERSGRYILRFEWGPAGAGKIESEACGLESVRKGVAAS